MRASKTFCLFVLLLGSWYGVKAGPLDEAKNLCSKSFRALINPDSKGNDVVQNMAAFVSDLILIEMTDFECRNEKHENSTTPRCIQQRISLHEATSVITFFNWMRNSIALARIISPGLISQRSMLNANRFAVANHLAVVILGVYAIILAPRLEGLKPLDFRGSTGFPKISPFNISVMPQFAIRAICAI